MFVYERERETEVTQKKRTTANDSERERLLFRVSFITSGYDIYPARPRYPGHLFYSGTDPVVSKI